MVILGLSHHYMFHLCRAEVFKSRGMILKELYARNCTCGASFIPGLGIDKSLDLEHQTEDLGRGAECILHVRGM